MFSLAAEQILKSGFPPDEEEIHKAVDDLDAKFKARAVVPIRELQSTLMEQFKRQDRILANINKKLSEFDDRLKRLESKSR